MSAVEWKKLGDVCSFQRGSIITEKDAIPGDVPVLSGGQKPAYYHNQYNRKGETVVVAGSGAYAGFVSFWDIPVFLSDSFSVNPNDRLNTKYVFYFLKNIQDKIFATKKGSGVPHVHGSSIAKFEIPIPSLAKQQEIVSHLDTFTTLISNLESELDMRRKQYEHYRNQLLDFEGVEGVEWKTLGEVCTIITGGEVPENTNKGQLEPSKEYPYAVYTNGKEVYGYTNNYQLDVESVCISSIGANTGAVFYRNGKFTPAIRLKVLIPNAYLLAKYLFYISEITDFSGKNTGSVPNINANYVKRIVIPVPSLKTQQEIVEKLDAFEQLIQSLEQEIKLRKQQYEYYREKVLTFD